MRNQIGSRTLRKFGLLVGCAFAVVGIWPLLMRGAPVRAWALVPAILLALPAIVFPGVLVPFYRAWMAFGNALGWINTKIILGILFYAVFTPAGLIRRLLSGNPLHLRFEPDATTYRAVRQPRPGTHMKRQF